MNTNKLLVSFLALFVAIFAINTVIAGNLNITIDEVSVNDEDITEDVLAGVVGEDVEVRVKFTITDSEDLEDLKVRTWISGYKDDIEASTSRFEALSGRTYIKKLNLELPNVMDIEDIDEDLTLHIEVSDKNDDIEQEYELTVQRESYVYDLLSVEAPSQASAGDIIAIDVVLKNTGSEELEDSFVIAKIPELGLSRKVYFGDITPEDNYDNDDDATDARERRIYLTIPSDAKSGDYDLQIKASNYDASQDIVKNIKINGATATEDNKAIDAGTSTTGKATDKKVSNSVIVLTVILVIIFLVLLIVLLVLLTRKPAEKEDFGETSYY